MFLAVRPRPVYWCHHHLLSHQVLVSHFYRSPQQGNKSRRQGYSQELSHHQCHRSLQRFQTRKRFRLRLAGHCFLLHYRRRPTLPLWSVPYAGTVNEYVPGVEYVCEPADARAGDARSASKKMSGMDDVQLRGFADPGMVSRAQALP